MKNIFNTFIFFVALISLFSCEGKQLSNDSTMKSFYLSQEMIPIEISTDSQTTVMYNLSRTVDPERTIAYIEIAQGAVIRPNSLVNRDYTDNGVTYVIISEDGQSRSVYTFRAEPYDAELNPYGVYSVSNLNDIRDNLDESFILMNDIVMPDISTQNVTQVVGIDDYDIYGWMPIAHDTDTEDLFTEFQGDAFTGSLDGNNYAIKNLIVNRHENDYIGLVGFSTGTIENLTIEGVLVGRDYVGGIVGENGGEVFYSSSLSEISGDYNIGGLVGTNSGTITTSFSTGSVVGFEYVGGLVGLNEYIIEDSYSKSTVVASVSNVGGFVGSNDGEIERVYSAGEVSGEMGVLNIGGLIGIQTGTVIDSFWDINTSGQNISSGGTGLTTEQMMDKNNYSNWAFGDIWEIDESSEANPNPQNGGLPLT